MFITFFLKKCPDIRESEKTFRTKTIEKAKRLDTRKNISSIYSRNLAKKIQISKNKH